MLAILTSHPIQYQAPLWRALADDGRVPFEVWFLTDHAVKPTHDREFGKQFAWDRDLLEGYPHRFLPVESGWRMDRFRGIKVTESWSKLFKERGVTQLWVEGWRFSENWAAIFAARRAGIEVWLRGETNDLRPRSGPKEMIRRFLLGRLFARVSRFLCIGKANRRFYQSFGIEEERLLSAPYCVDNAWFAKQASGRAGLPGPPIYPQRGEMQMGRAAIRRQWGIPDDAFCLLFCGKFIPKKRPLDVVAAAQQVMAKLPDRKIHLLFVGSGMLGNELREACQVVFDAEKADSGERASREELSEAGGQRTEVRGQRSEVGGQRSEVGGQRTEDRGQRSESLVPSEAPQQALFSDNRQQTTDNSPLPLPLPLPFNIQHSKFKIPLPLPLPLPLPFNIQHSKFKIPLPLPPATFAGFLNQGEIVSAYVAADCLVLPSDTGETWGLVVNEAMAVGLPCIASDQCGSAEDLVLPLSNTAVFPMGDLAALTRAIEDQIEHPLAAELVLQQVAMFGIDRTVATVVAVNSKP